MRRRMLVRHVRQAEEWRAVLSAIKDYDFYHTPEYHEIEAERLGAEPLLLVGEDASGLAALPVLIRSVEGLGIKDATSVYGYAGLLRSPDALAETDQMQAMLGQMGRSLADLGVVTLFTRLHPLVGHDLALGHGEVATVGSTVSLDLTLSEPEQFAQYRRDHRSDIRRLMRQDFSCRVSHSPQEVALFHELYLESLVRLNASPEYHFSLDYLQAIMARPELDVRLILCEWEGEVVAGATFTFQHPFVQGHLAATGTPFLRHSPMKLIYDATRRISVAEGYEVLHLGGGVGGQRDSLFEFKRGFAPREHDFRVWRWVLDEERYRAACAAVGRPATTEGFFPAYRAPAQTVPALGERPFPEQGRTRPSGAAPAFSARADAPPSAPGQ